MSMQVCGCVGVHTKQKYKGHARLRVSLLVQWVLKQSYKVEVDFDVHSNVGLGVQSCHSEYPMCCTIQCDNV